MPMTAKRTLPKWMKKKTTYKKSKSSLYTNQNKSSVTKTSVAAKTRSLGNGYFKTHLGGFPQRYTQSLRYATVGSGSLAGGNYAEATVIVMNGAYDPDAALGGGQPGGFAKLMAVYTKCYVRSSKMTVVINNTTNGSPLPQQWGITLSTLTSAMNYLTATQSGMVVEKSLGFNPDQITLTQSVDCGKFFSVDDLLDGSTQYCCTASGNPTQLIAGHLWLYSNYAAGSTGYFAYTVTVDFDCIFADPQPFT